MTSHKRPASQPPNPPAVVRIERALPPGRHALLDVFPGLDRSPAWKRYPATPAQRRRLARETKIEIARRKGEWMYVAPHEMPPRAPRRWRPVVTPDDCIVVSGEHLRKSPALVVYLDILHELCHVLQRWKGRPLWDERYEYVDRPTELQAYRFGNREARRLGASDAFLAEYLRVEWVNRKDHQRLLRNLRVRAG